ncbi:putative clamp loader subunit DNA polymerase accessory protein [Rhizobium phage RHph_I1_18]|nr:putative clamp loader subunit DNA polymerase accessory protein [Rhizobium phage RHph_I1_18]
MSNGPFAYVEAINKGEDIAIGKDYNQYLINKAFSYHPDCVVYADYLNQHRSIPDEAHFKFLRSVIRPRKRFSKWPKPSISPEIQAIMQYFRISQREAEQYAMVLSADQQQYIIGSFETGK